MSYYGRKFVSEYTQWKARGETELSKILKFLEKTGKVDHNSLSLHPCLTWKDVEKDLRADWNWNRLSDHPMLTWEIVSRNPRLPWNWYRISRHHFVTWNLMQENPQFPFDLRGFVEGPNVTYSVFQEIVRSKNMPWKTIGTELILNNDVNPLWVLEIIDSDESSEAKSSLSNVDALYEYLCAHPLISLPLIKKLGTRVSLEDVSGNLDAPEEVIRYLLSIYPEFDIQHGDKLSLDFVEKFFRDRRDYSCLSDNPNVGIGFLLRHKEKKWNWKILSVRIPARDILANRELPWHSNSLFLNPTMTLDIIIKLVTEGVLVSDLHRSHMMNIDFVAGNMQMKWNFSIIGASMSLEDIENHPDLPWDWQGILYNPNITLNFLLRHLANFKDIGGLIDNHLGFEDLCIDWRSPPEGKIKIIERDIKQRKEGVKREVIDIYGRDISTIIVPYVSYD